MVVEIHKLSSKLSTKIITYFHLCTCWVWSHLLKRKFGALLCLFHLLESISVKNVFDIKEQKSNEPWQVKGYFCPWKELRRQVIEGFVHLFSGVMRKPDTFRLSARPSLAGCFCPPACHRRGTAPAAPGAMPDVHSLLTEQNCVEWPASWGLETEPFPYLGVLLLWTKLELARKEGEWIFDDQLRIHLK